MFGLLFGGLFGGLFVSTIVEETVKSLATQAVVNLACDAVGIDRGPSVLDKIDVVLTDVETEGRKRGYTKAAEMYTAAIESLEKEYASAAELLRNRRDAFNTATEELCAKLEELTRKKEALEAEMNRKTVRVARVFDMPVSEVMKHCVVERRPNGGICGLLVLDLVYACKKGMLQEAEQQGFMEARQAYEEKLATLRANLRQVVVKTDETMRRYSEFYEALLEEIAQMETRVAELNVLLES